MRTKIESPYSASITGGGFLLTETVTLLPLLLSEKRAELLKHEAINNELLQINAETARKRSISEVAKRFDSMPRSFWEDFASMSEADQAVANFYVILKTYKIIFDFHINVTLRKWNSISKSLEKDDIMPEIYEISSRDEYVDSWSDQTKDKIASAYLTILRRVGMLDDCHNLRSLSCGNFEYYIEKGEQWFLEACLLQPYEIETIKRRMS